MEENQIFLEHSVESQLGFKECFLFAGNPWNFSIVSAESQLLNWRKSKNRLIFSMEIFGKTHQFIMLAWNRLEKTRSILLVYQNCKKVLSTGNNS